MATGRTILETAPIDAPPICCGCGNEVDPKHAKTTPDFRLVCKLCAPRYGLGEKKKSRSK